VIPALQLPDAEEPSISGLRVLVVDDDADARELVALTLESRGAVIKLASSAAEALDFVTREKPDVMIANIGMPHEDGYKPRTDSRQQPAQVFTLRPSSGV
jgi:CheY-like chemotaxis protein